MAAENNSGVRHLVAKMLREPILQFLIVALLLFVANRLINGAENNTTTQVIQISAGQVKQIANRYQLLAKTSPNQAELTALVDEYIEEEIAYREAIALGLDVDDTIIRRRLRQKLNFLSEDASASEEPSQEQLKTWLLSHAEQYRLPARLSFRHVLLSQDQSDKNTKMAALALLEQLKSGINPEKLGDATVVPTFLSHISQDRLAALFGEPFASSVFDATQSHWFGPITSPYGEHLILISERSTAREVEYNEVVEQLRGDWIEAKRLNAKNAFLSKIRQKYQVEIEWPRASISDANTTADLSVAN